MSAVKTHARQIDRSAQVLFWQAKDCSAVHVQINPSYLNFFRAVATSLFATDAGVNLGFGCASHSADHRQALTEHATASHFVQVALALQIKCSCIRAAIATKGGQLRAVQPADLSYRCTLSPSDSVHALLRELEAVARQGPSREWASTWAAEPSTLMQYLASFYGTMATQSLADVSVPEDKLRAYLSGMQALLVFARVIKGLAKKAKDAQTKAVVEFLLDDCGCGRPFSDDASRRQAFAIVSGVVACYRGRQAGLAVLQPFHKSKHELFRPNTTWCNKQDRRRYSIGKDDRDQEDRLAMIALPMDTVSEVEHQKEIICWLPLISSPVPASAAADTQALRSSDVLGVMTYDASAQTHDDAVAFAKSVRAIVGGDDLTRRRRERMNVRPGRVAYSAMIGLASSAAFEAPYHVQASRAMVETLVSAGVVGMQELEMKLNFAFPNDPVDSRQTAIALVFSDPTTDTQLADSRLPTSDSKYTRPKSPRPKSPRPKSPCPKSPRPKSPRPKSPRPKSPRSKSPRPKSPRPKSPRPKSPRPKSPRPKSPYLKKRSSAAVWPELYLRDKDEITSCEDAIVVSAEAEPLIHTFRTNADVARSMAVIDRFGAMVRVLRSDAMDRMFLCISSRSIDLALTGDAAIPLLEFFTTDEDRIVLDKINEDADDALPETLSMQDDDIESTDMVAMRGIVLHAAQVTAISVASDPIISHKGSQMYDQANVCHRIVSGFIELSQNQEMNDEYMGRGYTDQLRRLQHMLRAHAGFMPTTAESAERFQIVLPSNVWLHTDCETQFAELQHNMRFLRAVIVEDEPGQQIPIIAFSTAFTLSHEGKVLDHEASQDRTYVEITEHGEEYAVVDEILVLRATQAASSKPDLQSTVRASRKYEKSMCIENIHTPYVHVDGPLYVFALTKFQRDTIHVCASHEIRKALEVLAAANKATLNHARRLFK